MQFQTNSPIYLQVIDDIRRRLVLGELAPGEKMPSVRELALQYEINPNTAARVYKEMESMKLCFTRRGLGTFITEDEEVFRQIRGDMAGQYIEAFITGMKSLGYEADDMIQILKEHL
jgi:DNA-binding transcriptional regulator YhcF (GntR family)